MRLEGESGWAKRDEFQHYRFTRLTKSFGGYRIPEPNECDVLARR